MKEPNPPSLAAPETLPVDRAISEPLEFDPDEGVTASPRSRPFGSAHPNLLLSLILAAVAVVSWLTAYQKPFWYDEVITIIMCRLPGMSAVRSALASAADTNPPLFYFIARAARQLIGEDHLGYRLPSILGILCTLLCLNAICAKRVDRISALVGATFVLCTPLTYFASEARPYALMIACLSAAILFWQRNDESKLYAFGLLIALAAAVSLHYYAILVWPAFLLAEASVSIFQRRFRILTWLAVIIGAVPILIFADLLSKLRQYYGQHFWAQPGFSLILSAPSYLFNVSSQWGVAFMTAAIVILCWSAVKYSRETLKDSTQTFPIAESVLAVTLLLLPFMAVVAAKLAGGGMTTRYLIPSILGGALAVSFFASKAPPAIRALLLVLMLMNYGISSLPVLQMAVTDSRLDARIAAAGEPDALLAKYRASGLPVVISSGLAYLPMAYYLPPGKDLNLYQLVDPPAAIAFAGTDSVDLALISLRQYFPLKVEDYAIFASQHREFILVAELGQSYNWWSARLLQDGHSLTLLSIDGTSEVYKVVLNAPRDPAAPQ